MHNSSFTPCPLFPFLLHLVSYSCQFLQILMSILLLFLIFLQRSTAFDLFLPRFPGFPSYLFIHVCFCSSASFHSAYLNQLQHYKNSDKEPGCFFQRKVSVRFFLIIYPLLQIYVSSIINLISYKTVFQPAAVIYAELCLICSANIASSTTINPRNHFLVLSCKTDINVGWYACSGSKRNTSNILLIQQIVC